MTFKEGENIKEGIQRDKVSAEKMTKERTRKQLNQKETKENTRNQPSQR